MPYMQRITWSGVALHAGVVPGYPASHGCIRLTPAFAAELWGMTRIGARVVVAPDDVEAHELTHAALPVPAASPVPDKVASAGDALTKAALAASDAGGDRPLETGAAPQRLLLPMERALAAKVRAAAEAVARTKAAKAAQKFSGEKTAEAKTAVAAARKAEKAAAGARTKFEAATRAVERARTPAAAERATAAQAAARAALEEAETAAAEAAREQDGRTSEAFDAVRAARDAEEASAQAAAAKEAAARGVEPVSILISRKTGRIYVRQAWAPVYEAPVTFKEPELPLGTHLYLATGAEEGGRTLRWLSVSMPSSPPRAEPGPRRAGRTRGQAAAPPPAPVAQPNVTAAQALDRVELSPEARAFIADRLWAGAALIVTDHAISEETRKTTDFIVLTR
jgi:hypothetical protein